MTMPNRLSNSTHAPNIPAFSVLDLESTELDWHNQSCTLDKVQLMELVCEKAVLLYFLLPYSISIASVPFHSSLPIDIHCVTVDRCPSDQLSITLLLYILQWYIDFKIYTNSIGLPPSTSLLFLYLSVSLYYSLSPLPLFFYFFLSVSFHPNIMFPRSIMLNYINIYTCICICSEE